MNLSYAIRDNEALMRSLEIANKSDLASGERSKVSDG